MEKTKVLMVGNDSSVKGGITSVIQQLLGYDWDKVGVDMKFIPTYIDANPYKKIMFFVNAYGKIKNYIRKNKPDVVHIHMSYRGSYTRAKAIHKLCLKYKILTIIHLHGSEFEKWFNSCNEKKQKEIRQFMRETGAFIVLGDKWNETIKRIEPDCNTMVVENAIKIPEYKAKLEKGKCRFLFMGVLIKRKGVQDLIKAAKQVLEKHPEINICYEIAGTGEEENNLKELVKKNKLEKYFEFTGWIDGKKKEECYKRSTVMVLPSYNEGLPIAILEAISYGLPVIATDVGDIAAAVHNGKNGYLISPGDINALADSIVKICDEMHYKTFSDYSKRLAQDKFDENKFFNIFSEIYHKNYGGF